MDFNYVFFPDHLTCKCTLYKKMRHFCDIGLHNCNFLLDYNDLTPAMSSMPIAWQTDLFIRIASRHKTKCSTGGTIAPPNMLSPASWGSKIDNTETSGHSGSKMLLHYSNNKDKNPTASKCAIICC